MASLFEMSAVEPSMRCARSSRRVLVVDAADIQLFLWTVLRQYGYDVAPLSLPSALKAMQEESFDAVVTNTPEYFLESGVPVLYISGSPDPDSIQKLKGRDAFLPKPFDPAELIRILEQM